MPYTISKSVTHSVVQYQHDGEMKGLPTPVATPDQVMAQMQKSTEQHNRKVQARLPK